MCFMKYNICSACYAGHPRFIQFCDKMHPPLLSCPQGMELKFQIVTWAECGSALHHGDLQHLDPPEEAGNLNPSHPGPIMGDIYRVPVVRINDAGEVVEASMPPSTVELVKETAAQMPVVRSNEAVQTAESSMTLHHDKPFPEMLKQTPALENGDTGTKAESSMIQKNVRFEPVAREMIEAPNGEKTEEGEKLDQPGTPVDNNTTQAGQHFELIDSASDSPIAQQGESQSSHGRHSRRGGRGQPRGMGQSVGMESTARNIHPNTRGNMSRGRGRGRGRGNGRAMNRDWRQRSALREDSMGEPWSAAPRHLHNMMGGHLGPHYMNEGLNVNQEPGFNNGPGYTPSEYAYALRQATPRNESFPPSDGRIIYGRDFRQQAPPSSDGYMSYGQSPYQQTSPPSNGLLPDGGAQHSQPRLPVEVPQASHLPTHSNAVDNNESCYGPFSWKTYRPRFNPQAVPFVYRPNQGANTELRTEQGLSTLEQLRQSNEAAYSLSKRSATASTEGIYNGVSVVEGSEKPTTDDSQQQVLLTQPAAEDGSHANSTLGDEIECHVPSELVGLSASQTQLETSTARTSQDIHPGAEDGGYTDSMLGDETECHMPSEPTGPMTPPQQLEIPEPHTPEPPHTQPMTEVSREEVHNEDNELCANVAETEPDNEDIESNDGEARFFVHSYEYPHKPDDVAQSRNLVARAAISLATNGARLASRRGDDRGNDSPLPHMPPNSPEMGFVSATLPARRARGRASRKRFREKTFGKPSAESEPRAILNGEEASSTHEPKPVPESLASPSAVMATVATTPQVPQASQASQASQVQTSSSGGVVARNRQGPKTWASLFHNKPKAPKVVMRKPQGKAREATEAGHQMPGPGTPERGPAKAGEPEKVESTLSSVKDHQLIEGEVPVPLPTSPVLPDRMSVSPEGLTAASNNGSTQMGIEIVSVTSDDSMTAPDTAARSAAGGMDKQTPRSASTVPMLAPIPLQLPRHRRQRSQNSE